MPPTRSSTRSKDQCDLLS